MNERITPLDGLERTAAGELLETFCGSRRWVQSMLDARPFSDSAALFAAAESAFATLERDDWLEAFAAHPKIGDLEGLRARFPTTHQLSSGEQAGVAGASEDILQRLAAGNTAYQERFGYLFIVCASGKGAGEMLALLEERLHNEPDRELEIAAGEQAKITRLRLHRWLGDESTADPVGDTR